MVGMLVRLLFGPEREPVAFPVHSSHTTSGPVLLFSGSSRVVPGDIGRPELAAVLPLIGLMVWIGVWPRFFTARMESALEEAFPAAVATDSAGPAGREPLECGDMSPLSLNRRLERGVEAIAGDNVARKGKRRHVAALQGSLTREQGAWATPSPLLARRAHAGISPSLITREGGR
jgi:hypothetical protein